MRDPQQLNYYAYARNSPIVYKDPSGRCVDGISTAVCFTAGALLTTIVVGTAAELYGAITGDARIIQAGQSARMIGESGGATLIQTKGGMNPVTGQRGMEFRVGEGVNLSAPVKQGSNKPSSSPVLKGSQNPNTASAAKYGQYMHKNFDYGEGYTKEFQFKNGLRADAINHTTQHIIELKPNNPTAIQRGEAQLQKYIDQANKQFPGSDYTGEVRTYKPLTK